MVFEEGKFYKHNTGSTLRIICKISTVFHGNCLLGENNNGDLLPVGESEANAENYVEISEEEFMKPILEANKTEHEPISFDTIPGDQKPEHRMPLNLKLIDYGRSDNDDDVVPGIEKYAAYRSDEEISSEVSVGSIANRTTLLEPSDLADACKNCEAYGRDCEGKNIRGQYY